MKRLVMVAAIVLVAAVALADRVDTWLASSVVVNRVELTLISDGGCAVSASATVTKSDGGVGYYTSSTVEVAGANRTTCLDILTNKAPVLFKNDQGL